MNCLTCPANCCRNIILPIALEVNEDQKRWIELHGLQVEIKQEDDLKIAYLKVETPCSKLKDFKCTIYKDRPQVCKDYTCD